MSIPVWVVLLALVVIACGLWFNRAMRVQGLFGGDHFGGCLAVLVCIIGCLAVLLAHSWRWV